MTTDKADRSRKGQVLVEGDYATITFQRTLRHAPELVWEAITNPRELKEWLMCSSATIEGRTGGTIEMVAGPAQFHVKGKILTWDPPRVFEYEWKVSPVPEMPRGEDAIFRYELTQQEGSTLLTVTYRHITKQTAYGFAPGTHVLLDRLEAQLDEESLPDWMTRFTEARRLYPGWSK
jgi:uncharacterized protein YndB with AHSA1/START domain